jgi:hypothetical protein
MANYLAAWKTFRRLGDEPFATARHVIAQPAWPARTDLSILDIGCGDGRMAEAFLLALPSPAERLYLVDPDADLIAEAVAELSEVSTGTILEAVPGVADKEALEIAPKVGVGLAVHVVYLMAHSRFRSLVERWPKGVPLFVVLDAPGSIFSELWALTAPEYAVRTNRVHDYLNSVTGVPVELTTFTTRVANPFTLSLANRRRVLSLLCYSEFEHLEPEKQRRVEELVRQRIVDDGVQCTCCCYAITR